MRPKEKWPPSRGSMATSEGLFLPTANMEMEKCTPLSFQQQPLPSGVLNHSERRIDNAETAIKFGGSLRSKEPGETMWIDGHGLKVKQDHSVVNQTEA